MTSITTKAGDTGTTSLFGGSRVCKASQRLHAYGTVDELNAILGIVLADSDVPPQRREELAVLQHRLFLVGSDLATPLNATVSVPRIDVAAVGVLDGWIAHLESVLPPQTHFLLPAGSAAGAHLHLARTVCRRAERHVAALAAEESVTPAVLVYLNRLSDYLFLCARDVNRSAGAGEEYVSAR